LKSGKDEITFSITLPRNKYIIIRYLVDLFQSARSDSDLFIQALNDYLDKRRVRLNDTHSWRELIKKLDISGKKRLDELFEKFDIDK
jgi:hypothetical protein